MPETTQTPPTSSSSSAKTGNGTGTALQATKGTTKIADSVVTKVAGIAAREVAGVYDLGNSGARAIGNVGQRVGIDNRSQGVSVEVGERQASVDVTVVVEYGESIPEITEEVRQQVIRRVEGICGLQVTEVDISVTDLHFAGDDADDQDNAQA